MTVLLFLYGLAGLVAALCLAYALTDPTDDQPDVTEGAEVVATAVLWPLWVACIVVSIVLQVTWDRRRQGFYGSARS